MEIDTDKLQDQIAEEHERAGEAWIRYIGLSAALFAVIAAISALRSANLINEALIHQIQASDTWNEYQASRQKEHLYTVAADGVADSTSPNKRRLSAYRREVAKEAAKEPPLSSKAHALEEDSTAEVTRHHSFEYAVALLQVGIALGAVAALARSKPAWYVSMVSGLVGIFFFLRGFAL
jgi:Domain of unknown function (DUF4337)